MNVTGKLHAVMEVQQVTDTFRKREFVLEYADNPMYIQYILFQLVKDRVDLINGFQPGDMVDVSFNIRGRQWTSPQGEIKYFNSLEAWRINPAQPGQPQPEQLQSYADTLVKPEGDPPTVTQKVNNAAGSSVPMVDDDNPLPF